ncbi:hypothetical protein M436DRAFT_78151 [Aureobasidium namibiae CBS 147.97]|uniref:Uncharacterized protein n=1 Tax=Aureobasidium namibiae CBS 147.97 TaxID=1043004 RepID=A0A074X304_9PEZI
MCVGSIVTIRCEACGSSTDKSSYLGCATGEHDRSGWETRTDSIISRSTHLMPSCSSCPSSDSSDSSDFSLKSASSSSSLASLDEYEDEVSQNTIPYYSLGQASLLTEVWSENAFSSLNSFYDSMGSLIDRIIALPSLSATKSLKLNIFLIYSECDAYLQWTETEHARAISTETSLADVLNNTGVDGFNAINVEDMTADMVDLFECLTSFHPFYDVAYNAGRFAGYLSVLEERLRSLETEN